ncbi:cardiomyopathy-associated protein 5 [Thalassophryne amazonica]|uniref:cardiomyopathy-associated protein 5 n=1 Tax=Thalassophryne amazonica TaxID=390379 RepID=UPI0014714AE8|nr:cardiomyopathy-associated protein 5 [Thalassophryne amazonica]
MEECGSVETEMTELQELQSNASEAMGEDDEDEVEELRNSLREVVQDPTVKPKLQCLVVDPSFSMVTVQSEDSGIVWETASSRCSTPWASDTSSISEGYSMEGSGVPGKITIFFDEDKIVHRRTRSGGRSSRLSRPGSSRSTSGLGVERPEMAEVSVPNVKQEKTEITPDLEEIKSKDQQLFSLISEGYEILNIRVPSKLPTVDEEESTDLQDNLSYLDQTPKIRSRSYTDLEQPQNHALTQEVEILEHKEPLKEPSAETQQDVISDIDYFEKFTLVDEVVPGEQATDFMEEVQQAKVKPQAEEQKPSTEKWIGSTSVSEDSFILVTDMEIVGEHLDEVFYGNGAPAGGQHQRLDDAAEVCMRMRRDSQRSMKESGSVLFGSEETTLTPIFLSPGPPKIIDPILLEEPTAMSFMYSDLYEDAIGEKKSDEECSEAESMASEKCFKKCLSDSEETEGYLEKFILKDETPTIHIPSEPVKEKEGACRMMWSQSEFETTGCLTRVVLQEDEDNKGEPKPQEVSCTEMVKDAQFEEKEQVVKQNETEEWQLFPMREEQTIVAPSFEVIQESKPTDKVELQAQRDQTEKPEHDTQHVGSNLEKPKCEDPQRDQQCQQSFTETCQPHQTQTHMETTPEALLKPTEGAETKDPPGSEVNEMFYKSELPREITSEEPIVDAATVVSDDKMLTEMMAEALAQTETPEPAVCGESKAVLPELGVLNDCECVVGEVNEVTQNAFHENKIQDQVQDITKVEMLDVQRMVLEGEKGQELPVEETAGESPLLESQSKVEAADSESEIKVEISDKVVGPPLAGIVEMEIEVVPPEILESELQVEKEPVSLTELNKTSHPEGTGAVQEMVNVGDELILMVPKEQAMEMDIDINQRPEKIAKNGTEAPAEPCEYLLITQVATSSKPQEKADTGPKQEELPTNDSVERRYSPLVPVEKAETEGQEMEVDSRDDSGVVSTLRSFIPQVDLFRLSTDVDHEAETHQQSNASQTDIIKADVGPDVELQVEDVGQKMEQDEAAGESAEMSAEEMEYEIISKQEARELMDTDVWPEPGQKTGEEAEVEERMLDLSPEEDLFEADYDIIDAEEENQARLAAELQGMDWFCLTCGCLLSEEECASGALWDHEVTSVDRAYEDIKEKLGDWISELQGRSENIEDLVSEVELAYNSVEDQCVASEEAMQVQNEEMMALVMDQYNNMSVSMEEEKKIKLEQLYDQIVSFQGSIDAAKSTLETTAREAETDARSPEDIHARLKAALDSAMSLELGPRGLLVFEDYAKGNASSSHITHRKGIPVSQKPTLQPQEPGSATSTSVTVYWRVNPGDIIDCFQVYCMEDPQGAVSEEYRVTVKESYSVLEELEPGKTYKVWVMAVNYTGCSLPSERLTFRTAPPVPVIDTERCTVMWDSATLRWNSATETPGQTYTLEYCRQYDLEGEGLRSMSDIKSCEQNVLLQPNENYLCYIKAVNEAGASEQSEAALISTKGTRFHLLRSSAHPALELSADCTTLSYSQSSQNKTGTSCPSILGDLLPAQGRYYWETVVSGRPAYRIGVVYRTVSRNRLLGENNLSWCLQCVPTSSSCRFQLLHNDVQSSVFVTEMPERVGTLLDYQLGRLSFYSVQSGQLLGSFSHRFTQQCHPALGLETAGSLQLSAVQEVPKFAEHS